RDPNKAGAGAPKATTATVSTTDPKKPALESGPTWGGPAASAAASGGAAGGPVSRGYRAEMGGFADGVKLWTQTDKANRRLPRCHGKVAMADAIIALTSNISMGRKQRIEFKDEWFDPNSPEVPDADVRFDTV